MQHKAFRSLASRASGYPLLQKPHFQIMSIYNSFIIFLVGFLPLVGEFLPQSPCEKTFKPSAFLKGRFPPMLRQKLSQCIKHPFNLLPRLNKNLHF